MVGIFTPQQQDESVDSAPEPVENTDTQTTEAQPEVIKPKGSSHCCGGCGGE